MLLLFVLCGVLLIAAIALCVKVRLLQKSADEIASQLEERLEEDTNNLIFVSSRDRHILRLASKLSEKLRLLRKQRRQYQCGDRELKEAVTNISHDLRTPLTAICGYLDLLQTEEKNVTVSRYLTHIENRTEALKQLTEELFRYSIIASAEKDLEMKDENLNRVLEESVAAFYAAFKGKGIVPAIDIPECPVMQRVNREALSRVFSNILSNALKYSSGDLKISLRGDGEILFSNSAPALSEVQVGKLFDRFFSVEAARNSTGLGLAIAKSLVERMNGEITAWYRDGALSVCIRFSNLGRETLLKDK